MSCPRHVMKSHTTYQGTFKIVKCLTVTQEGAKFTELEAALHGLVKAVRHLQLRDQEVTRELQSLKTSLRQLSDRQLKEPSTQGVVGNAPIIISQQLPAVTSIMPALPGSATPIITLHPSSMAITPPAMWRFTPSIPHPIPANTPLYPSSTPGNHHLVGVKTTSTAAITPIPTSAIHSPTDACLSTRCLSVTTSPMFTPSHLSPNHPSTPPMPSAASMVAPLKTGVVQLLSLKTSSSSAAAAEWWPQSVMLVCSMTASSCRGAHDDVLPAQSLSVSVISVQSLSAVAAMHSADNGTEIAPAAARVRALSIRAATYHPVAVGTAEVASAVQGCFVVTCTVIDFSMAFTMHGSSSGHSRLEGYRSNQLAMTLDIKQQEQVGVARLGLRVLPVFIGAAPPANLVVPSRPLAITHHLQQQPEAQYGFRAGIGADEPAQGCSNDVVNTSSSDIDDDAASNIPIINTASYDVSAGSGAAAISWHVADGHDNGTIHANHYDNLQQSVKPKNASPGFLAWCGGALVFTVACVALEVWCRLTTPKSKQPAKDGPKEAVALQATATATSEGFSHFPRSFLLSLLTAMDQQAVAGDEQVAAVLEGASGSSSSSSSTGPLGKYKSPTIISTSFGHASSSRQCRVEAGDSTRNSSSSSGSSSRTNQAGASTDQEPVSFAEDAADEQRRQALAQELAVEDAKLILNTDLLVEDYSKILGALTAEVAANEQLRAEASKLLAATKILKQELAARDRALQQKNCQLHALTGQCSSRRSIRGNRT
eukprot:jgi/Chrzof1/6747/Cz19g07180.t1